MTTLGKYRCLNQCSTPGGHFVVLAIDHRDNLLQELNRHAPEPLDDAGFIAFKQEVIRALAPNASALLTDPTYGLGPGIASGAIPGRLGLMSPLEITDYSVHPSRRQIQVIPGWSVAKIKRVGAQGVKLLVFYHPETEAAQSVRDTVSRVVEECAAADIPLFLEPLAYSPDESRPLPNEELTQVVVDAARTFSDLGVDILKLPFPIDVKQEADEDVWRRALAEVNAASRVPWTLLSAGVDFDTFYRQSELACEAGASGVIVGRAVWADVTRLQGEERADFVGKIARERMAQLGNLCARSATSWRDRVSAPDLPLDWYQSYGN